MSQRKQTRKERIARRLVQLFLLVSILGAGLLIHWLYFKVREVRIAVTDSHGAAATLLTATNDWLVSERRRFRLRLVATGSEAASLDKLEAGAVEVAVVRGDQVRAGKGNSVMVLFNELAGVMIPPGSSVKDWTDLQGRTIGVPTGTPLDSPLLLALLRLNGVPQPKLVPLEMDAIRTAIDRRQVQAIGFVSPVPGFVSRNFRQFLGSKGASPTFLTVDDPDLLALKDKRFASATIVAGSLRVSPPVPDEAIGTLSVGRHMIVRPNINNFIVANFVRTMLDARRALFTDQPLFVQAGSPDIEADAYVKVHEAAKKIYNGDEPSWADMALEWIYIVPMMVGALGTLAVWLFQRFIHPDYRDPSDLVVDLLDVRADVREVTSLDGLRVLRVRIDEIADELGSEAYEYAGMDEKSAVLTAILIAEGRINDRKAELLRKEDTAQI